MKSVLTKLGVAVLAVTAPFSALAQDATMTCPQIMQSIGEQNGIIKQQGDTVAQLNSTRPDPGDPDPAIARRKAQIKSDRATERAHALVTLGRQKRCFQ